MQNPEMIAQESRKNRVIWVFVEYRADGEIPAAYLVNNGPTTRQ